MIIDEEEYLAHYGTPRRSGRYPWGSGGNIQRSIDFLSAVKELKDQGMTDAQIAKGLGFESITELRAKKSIASNEVKQSQISRVQRLHDAGLSNVAIGLKMGIPESTVRSLRSQGDRDTENVLFSTANMLRDQVKEKQMIDVGVGVENHLGISQTRLATAVAMLKEEGYTVAYFKEPQLGTVHETRYKVLAAPGISPSEVFRNRKDVRQIDEFSEDHGRTFLGIHPPLDVSSSRIGIKYGEDGGGELDGVIYVRPGVSDLSLGANRYAQVRISVDGTHYLKGMAVYKDDLPKGVDLVFNTPKSDTGNKLDAMKPLKDDPDNPFGSTVRQIFKTDPVTGKEQLASAMNIVNEDQDWEKWSNTLSSQMLSKQSSTLIKEQLNKAYDSRKQEYDEIMALTNPAVRKKLLQSFADEADSASLHLKAAALPRQASHVILPVTSLKDTEVYAPNYNHGERVVLIRHPHGGPFEIPELIVNNRNKEAVSIIGQAAHAIGINSHVAQRLSGADFDGDTVLVIPNGANKIRTAPALEGLKNFDPKHAYPGYPGMKVMSNTQTEMGLISNLITDMSIHGASDDEMARAVRHSMVVIDAEKKELNYKESARVNNIAQLRAKYQTSARGGASTLISRKKSPEIVPERVERPARLGGPIDPKTGKKVYVETNRTYVNKMGEVTPHTTKTTKLAETDDASTLSSGTVIEKHYAEHSNKLKALANEARLAYVNTKSVKYSPSAKAAYANEVASLNTKLDLAQRNRPLERQAQLVGNATFRLKRQANPDMDATERKKIKAQALAEARTRVGLKPYKIEITQEEWNAVQAGAITQHKLEQILDKANLTQVKQLATPKDHPTMSTAKVAQAQQLFAAGKTQAEVAEILGVGLTTLKESLKEG